MIFMRPLLPLLLCVCSCCLLASEQLDQVDDHVWKIGGKMYFEAKAQPGIIGTQDIHSITKSAIEKFILVDSDHTSSNAKMLLRCSKNKIRLGDYRESNRPDIGEQLHATVLYTKPRGFSNSETLLQICDALFLKPCEKPPSVQEVAQIYSKTVQPESKFKISEIIFVNGEAVTSFVIAKLLLNGHENIYSAEGKPISAGLHMTLLHISHCDIKNETMLELVDDLNDELQGKWIKVALNNGMVDLEFGMSGASWRIRAGEYFSLVPSKQ